MLHIKINYENGDYEHTNINATQDEARAYYIDKMFNIGSVSDNMQRCTDIEILEN